MKFKKEHEKFTVWKIANNPKFMGNTQRGGTILLATMWKQTPNKLTLKELKYGKGEARENISYPPGTSYILSIKNKSLNVYSRRVDGDGVIRVRNISTDPQLLNRLHMDIDKKVHYKRLARVINHFFILNKFPRRLKIKIEDYTATSNLIECIYPGLKNLSAPPVVDSSFSRHLRKEIGIKGLIKKTFGSRGSKLTKTVLRYIEDHKNLSVFRAGVVAKGLAPLDWIIDNLHGELWSKVRDVPGFRRFLKTYSEEARERLLGGLTSKGEYRVGGTASDAISMWTQLSRPDIPKDLKTWDEIHNYLMKEHRKLKKADREIKYSEDILKIDSTRVGDLTIELPKSSHKLIEYSQKMNNCISSYANSAVGGKVILLGIYRNDELTYNVEVRNHKIVQFVGKHNSPAPKKDRDEVDLYLFDAKIVNETTPIVEPPVRFEMELADANRQPIDRLAMVERLRNLQPVGGQVQYADDFPF